jgi:hypothetical protein
MFISSIDPHYIDGNAIHPTSELDGLSGGKVVAFRAGAANDDGEAALCGADVAAGHDGALCI